MRGEKAREDSRAQMTGGMIKGGRFFIIHRKTYFLDPHWITRENGRERRRQRERHETIKKGEVIGEKRDGK